MIIGCPKEIKTKEHRVGLIPAAVMELSRSGHRVLIESGAGLGAGISDDAYVRHGAEMIDDVDALWGESELIVKVKEPLEPEYARMRKGQVLYTYLHLAAAKELTEVMLEKEVHGIAYETIERRGYLPLLKPMSEVAGKMATQVGAMCLDKHQGGKGVLLGGIPGVPRGHVVIIGGGVVGLNAAKIAVGMGAEVTILDRNVDRLAYLDDIFGNTVRTLYSTPSHVTDYVRMADLVIGAVLVAGARAPMLVTADHVKEMQAGSVIVDVSVDQGGCVETSRVTTHDAPTFLVDDVVHYGVANMPGAVARTSTYALNHATLPYLLKLANLGLKEACTRDEGLLKGVNIYGGSLTYQAVAEALDLPYTPIEQVI